MTTQETTDDERLGSRVWREVSQSTSSSEIAQGVSDLLAEHFEHDRFVLARLDIEHRRLVVIESLARGNGMHEVHDEGWATGADESFEDLVEWCRGTRTMIGHVSELGGSFSRSCPWSRETRVFVATLKRGEEDDEEMGFVVARLSGEASDPREDLELFESISEPLSAALHYDHGFGDAAAATADRPEARREHYQSVKRRELADVVMDARTGLGDVVEWVRRVAPSSEPILLIGETGTGKEVIARTIHNNSNFANGPMLRVNCGALSEGIVESKIFGAAEEEFTPATRREPGWFERARGGTMFLDEIDTLPESAQMRLSNWISTGRLERPESSETFDSELRLVAGNHTSLDDSETIRAELIEQLSTFPIHIPPLRARPEDIPALALQFAEKVGRRIGGAPLAPSGEDIELLVDYKWPGNIRELRTVIERAAILGNGKRLHVEEALGRIRDDTPEEVERQSSNGEDGTASIPTLDEAVRRHLTRALEVTEGQVAGEGGAAEVLDVHPSTLRSKLKRHDLDPADFR